MTEGIVKCVPCVRIPCTKETEKQSIAKPIESSMISVRVIGYDVKTLTKVVQKERKNIFFQKKCKKILSV